MISNEVWKRIATGVAGTRRAAHDEQFTVMSTCRHYLRAVQLLLGHTKIESTVRYIGIEVDHVLAIAEQVEV